MTVNIRYMEHLGYLRFFLWGGLRQEGLRRAAMRWLNHACQQHLIQTTMEIFPKLEWMNITTVWKNSLPSDMSSWSYWRTLSGMQYSNLHSELNRKLVMWLDSFLFLGVLWDLVPNQVSLCRFHHLSTQPFGGWSVDVTKTLPDCLVRFA